MGLSGSQSMDLLGINSPRIGSHLIHPNPFVRYSSSLSGTLSNPKTLHPSPITLIGRRCSSVLLSSSLSLGGSSASRSRKLHLQKSSNSHQIPPEVRSSASFLEEGEIREGEGKMVTEKTTAWISPDRRLVVDGRTVLTDVPPEVTSSADVDASGIFLGVDMAESCDRHIIALGKLRNIRFLACFRFKIWWMTQKMGNDGKEVPWETQFLLLEIPPSSSLSSSTSDGEVLYAALLPLFDGPFRASLRGSPDSSLLLSLESGDPTTTSHFSPRPLLLGPALTDPFAAISSAVAAARRHLGTFRRRVEKPPPPVVDLFGWCTWDAFYQDVCQVGVEDGLRSLSSGGAPPRFLIIDDGWQSVAQDGDAKAESIMRLSHAEENSKFKNGDAGIGHVVRLAKQRYGVKHVYTWHALLGYWGGVGPGMIDGCEVRYPTVPEGVNGNDAAFREDPIVVEGVGVVNPRNAFSFYDSLHGYLRKEGVDGVKVDVQSVLETVGGGLGGRVGLAKLYHEALDRSIAKHFRGAEIIACMSHSSDAIYCSKQTAVARASDDFYPRDPISHTIHIASVAYNSTFLGEFMLPDWDMFHSHHPAAEYHASARAISGGPVYVSDKPGHHNFELLRKLVLPDGSILRARLPGRPTKDCLFSDPTRDNISLLKIWNMNKFTGVLGVYNCQGAAWCGTEKKNVFHKTGTEALTTNVKGDDVHLISEAAAPPPNWSGDCAVYHHGGGDVVVLPRGASLPVSLKVLEHRIFTITPVKVLGPGLKFAPFGLLEMYNGGGAIERLSYEVAREFDGTKNSDNVGIVHVGLKGCGVFGAYSSAKPRKCSVGSKEAKFSYDPSSGLLKLYLEDMPGDSGNLHALVVEL